MTPDEVVEKIKFYSEKMDLPLPEHMSFYENEWIERYHNAHDHDHVREVKRGEISGANFGSGKEIFINLDMGRNDKELENTIVHELVHSKYKIDHSGRFWHYINEIKNGHYTPRSYNRLERIIWHIRWWFTT